MGLIDLSGQRFGRLKVIERTDNIGSHTAWLCQCDCGAVKAVRSQLLRDGQTRSCGCLCRETARKRMTSHGQCIKGGKVRPEYRAWMNMIDRCENKSHRSYPNYGGRGILVCVRWRRSFADFIKDVGERPSDKHSLDRIDNDGDYEPDNVQWSLWREQMNNKRQTRRVAIDGVTMSLKDWCRRLRLNYSTVRKRIARGWTLQRALGVSGECREIVRPC